MLYNIKINNNKFNPGCFMLYNTGKEAVTSTHGLLTTVAYQVFKRTGVREIRDIQVEGEAASYALEGSVAVAGLALRSSLSRFLYDL